MVEERFVKNEARSSESILRVLPAGSEDDEASGGESEGDQVQRSYEARKEGGEC